MNMISQIRQRFRSSNSVPVDRVILTPEEFDKLQAEWIKRAIPEDNDYRTHHGDWVNACEIARDCADSEQNAGYWQHQLDTLKNLNAAYIEKGE